MTIDANNGSLVSKTPDRSLPDDFDSLKPSERFARLAKKVFSVKKSDVDAYVRDNSLPPEKPGRKPKDR